MACINASCPCTQKVQTPSFSATHIVFIFINISMITKTFNRRAQLLCYNSMRNIRSPANMHQQKRTGSNVSIQKGNDLKQRFANHITDYSLAPYGSSRKVLRVCSHMCCLFTNDISINQKHLRILTRLHSMHQLQEHRFLHLENTQMFLYIIIGKQATQIGTDSQDFT